MVLYGLNILNLDKTFITFLLRVKILKSKCLSLCDLGFLYLQTDNYCLTLQQIIFICRYVHYRHMSVLLNKIKNILEQTINIMFYVYVYVYIYSRKTA